MRTTSRYIRRSRLQRLIMRRIDHRVHCDNVFLHIILSSNSWCGFILHNTVEKPYLVRELAVKVALSGARNEYKDLQQCSSTLNWHLPQLPMNLFIYFIYQIHNKFHLMYVHGCRSLLQKSSRCYGLTLLRVAFIKKCRMEDESIVEKQDWTTSASRVVRDAI